MIFNIIVTVLIGALSGWLAGMIMKTRSGGFIFNCVLGIIGSFVGSFAAALLGISAAKISVGGVLISVAGACLVVWIVRKIAK